jgi:glycosyltransferase involved in cell wall biosynthesis
MRVALLTNFVAPYRHSLYLEIARLVGDLRVFVSTPMESNREWPVDWSGLDVVLQKTLTFKRVWRMQSFSESIDVHVPYDTLTALRRFKPDVIITGEMGARSILAALFGRWRRTPVVLWATVSDHIESQRGSLRHAIRRALFRYIHSFVVNGESGAVYLHRFGIPDARMIRVPYTIDMRALLALPLEGRRESAHVLLYVGSLSKRKGILPFLDHLCAFAASRPTRLFTFVVVGAGLLESQLRGRVTPANLSVEWAGSVTYASLPEWYAKGTIFVFPTRGDEWGVVVNEALAAGLPILGSVYSQAVEELVIDGVNGWRFDPDDNAAVQVALDRVFSTSEPALHRMSAAARRSVSDITPFEAARVVARHLQQVVSEYQRVLS